MEKLEWPAKSKIQLEVKLSFGKDEIDCVYPVCVEAKIFAKIAGDTTLTPETLKRIIFLGYEVIQEQPAKLNFKNI